MVSQKEYEMIQLIGKHPPETVIKAILDARTAKVCLSAIPAKRQC